MQYRLMVERIFGVAILLTVPAAFSAAGTFPFGIDQLPVTGHRETPRADFLIDPSSYVAKLSRSPDGRELVLDNGLIRRAWRVVPNGACVRLDNLITGQTLLRSVRPEARVTIDGDAYVAGGLTGQPDNAYLTDAWLDAMQADPTSWRLAGVAFGKPAERLRWHRRRHVAPDVRWPPAGAYLRMDYRAPKGVSASANVVLSVHYEMYDGVPAMSKWITIENGSNAPIRVDRFRGEELAVVEQTNWVELRDGVRYPPPDYLHAETDFAFGGFHYANANRHTVQWRTDPDYKTQVNYLRHTPCLLVVEPTYGPAQDIAPGERFESFRIFELVYDDGNRERRGLTLRRMYRTLAPWITENPITHHLLSSDPDEVRAAIDHAAEVGFEAVILSFGSGFDMENTNADFLRRWKSVADHAERQGVELGAYSLFSSRSVGRGNDVVSPPGQQPTFGKAPAATSTWGRAYFQTIQQFFDTTGFDQFENDGPYPGDVDVTPRPPYQKGLADSRWAQWRIVTKLYQHLRSTGVYINQPDYYFFSGANKTGMGYREVNWSLPRSQQVIHTRQNIYDGTWEKTPSMGWMHVPLTQYHGGGAAATIEPLHEHLDHYERIMLSNLGMGVQAHYRGPRLYDTDATRRRVTGIVAWYKQYRDILESDILHGRRADGRDVDWVLHVNPRLAEKGMLCVYNPLPQNVTRTLRVNVYYTGLTRRVRVSESDGEPVELTVMRDNTIDLPVSVPAGKMVWYVLRAPRETKSDAPPGECP